MIVVVFDELYSNHSLSYQQNHCFVQNFSIACVKNLCILKIQFKEDTLVDDVVDKAVKEVKNILNNKKNKGAAVGATLGYVLSKENKERNAVLAGLAAYFLTKDNDNEEDDEE